MRKKNAFSLVEVLLALAIGGLILMAATSLLVTISQAWANRPATRDAFDAHVNGVANFLTAVLEEAALVDGLDSQKKAISLERAPGFSEIEDPLIYFFLREAPPLFFWPEPGGVASRVHVFIQVDERDGLRLLWYSDLQELEKNEKGVRAPEDEDELFCTLISPYCTKVIYCPYGDEDDADEDFKSWRFEPELDENVETGEFRLPAFIKLIFKWDEENLERVVTLAIERLAPSGIYEEPR
jgi:prepilin-type N-terminal cleavage/methylation domain-containing protein